MNSDNPAIDSKTLAIIKLTFTARAQDSWGQMTFKEIPRNFFFLTFPETSFNKYRIKRKLSMDVTGL